MSKQSLIESQFLIGTVLPYDEDGEIIECSVLYVSIPHRYGTTDPYVPTDLVDLEITVSIPHRYGTTIKP